MATEDVCFNISSSVYSHTLVVAIVNDEWVESGREMFVVSLSSDQSGVTADDNVTVTITDDDSELGRRGGAREGAG